MSLYSRVGFEPDVGLGFLGIVVFLIFSNTYKGLQEELSTRMGMAQVIIASDINMSFGFARDCGAYKIASELRRAGFSTQVLDFFTEYSLDELSDIVDKFVTSETILFGFATTHSVMDMTNEELINQKPKRRIRELFNETNLFPKDDEFMDSFLRMIKAKKQDIKIAVGGERVLRCRKTNTLVDFWVTGKADRAVVALAKKLNGEDIDLKSQKITNGYVINSDVDFKYDSFVKSNILWSENDYLFPDECLPIEISRSCAFNCRFCDFDKKGSTADLKDEAVLRDELLRNYELFGTTQYMVCDPTLNDSLSKVKLLHRLFTSMPFKLEWSSFLRLDLIAKHPEEMRDLLLESGARSVQFGIETFNQEAARLVGKPLPPEKAKELLYFLKETWQDRVLVGSGFIVGLPGDTEESLMESFEWLKSEDCPLDGALFTPLYIGHYDPKLEELETFSGFAKKPSSFGMEGDYIRYKNSNVEILDWSHKDMNRKRASELASYFASQIVNKPIFHLFHQMKNVNYSDEECMTMGLTFKGKFVEARKRRSKMKDVYLEKLLAGA